MKISGFSFVKNANLFAYPLLESVNSMLPLCDEVVIAVGKSDDDTLETLKSINSPKLKLIETVWNKNNNIDAKVYSEQTNIAYNQCTGDWCLYLQADEVLHENDYAEISKQFIVQNENENIEALLFKYKHFYGSYDYIGRGRQWYKREIRAIRNNPKFTSWGDAQGFRKVDENGNIFKLKAKEIDAYIYHYGWVRPPKAQGLKIANAQNYYHKGNFDLEKYKENTLNLESGLETNLEFNYSDAYELEKYKSTHPILMTERIKKDKIWTVNFDPTKLKPKPLRHKISDKIEKITGYRIGEYKDFIVVK
jgi:glycosyltransferase involved in cell wall biosynthesis